MNFDKKEANDRLDTIIEMISDANNRMDMLVSSRKLLKNITIVCTGEEKIEEENPIENSHITISCDASIKENPGGPAAVGIVIEFPTGKTLEMSRPSRATTNNQAEYEAIYFALNTLFNLHNNPGCLVEIRSDSRLAIEQLNKEMKCQDEKLRNKRDHILELVTQCPVPVRFIWRPRNSTRALEKANNMAQNELNVPNH